MPGHRVHAYVDRTFFGRVYWMVHRDMDWPVYFMKKNHRVYFHEMNSVYAIAQKHYPGDSNAVQSGWLHIQIDEACTNDPIYRAQLEFLAGKDCRERKRTRKTGRVKRPKRKRKEGPNDELFKLQKDIKKLAEIRFLTGKIRTH
jgi:hypothetical protein